MVLGQRLWALGRPTLVILFVALVGVGSARAAVAPLSWTAPVRVDHQAPYTTVGSIYAMSCASASLCVAGDDGGNVMASTNPAGGAAAWTTPTNIDGLHKITAVSCPSISLCVAVDNVGSVLASRTPTATAPSWTLTPNVDPGTYLTALSCPSVSLCVAVDTGGYVTTSTNPAGGASAWSSPVRLVAATIQGLTCPSVSLCVAVDSTGRIITSTKPTGGLSAWKATTIYRAGTGSFDGISCPSTKLCVAIGGGANGSDAVTSVNPTGGTSAWKTTAINAFPNGDSSVSCASASLCVVGGAGAVAVSTNPTGGTGAWPATMLGAQNGTAYALACPSVSLCVTSQYNGTNEADGHILASTHPTGGTNAWTDVQVDSVDALSGISCPSSGLCVAADQFGKVTSSTDPTGPAAAWSTTDVDSANGNSIAGMVSCVSASLCVRVDTGGDIATSINPGNGGSPWTSANVGSQLQNVSCPSVSLCVAVDANGSAFTSKTPTGPASGWASVTADSLGDLLSVSCPSVSLCVAVDAFGDVVSSHNPTGGASAWTLVRNVDTSGFGNAQPMAISCGSTSLCVIVDGSGNVVTSTDPTGPASAWTTTQVDGGRALGAISCASASLCVAVGGRDVVSSIKPTGGAGAWVRSTNVDTKGDMSGVSCARPAGLCVAVDTLGNVVRGTPLLKVAQTTSAPIVAADSTLTFTSTVTNTSATPLSGVSVKVALPANAMYRSGTPSQGNCSTPVGAVLSCSLGTIPAKGGASVSVVVRPIQPPTVTGRVSVSSSGSPLTSTASSAAAVSPAAGVSYVGVFDRGFQPATARLAQPGLRVQFDFYGPAQHSARDGSPLSLYDTGLKRPITYAIETYTAAGTYPVSDAGSAHTAAVAIGDRLSSTSVVHGQPVTITADSASAPPPSWRLDYEVLPPGGAWTNISVASTASSTIYTPTAPGTYQFRSHLRNPTTAAIIDWSPPVTLKAS